MLFQSFIQTLYFLFYFIFFNSLRLQPCVLQVGRNHLMLREAIGAGKFKHVNMTFVEKIKNNIRKNPIKMDSIHAEKILMQGQSQKRPHFFKLLFYTFNNIGSKIAKDTFPQCLIETTGSQNTKLYLSCLKDTFMLSTIFAT